MTLHPKASFSTFSNCHTFETTHTGLTALAVCGVRIEGCTQPSVYRLSPAVHQLAFVLYRRSQLTDGTFRNVLYCGRSEVGSDIF